MLELKNIKKIYEVGGNKVPALDGIDLSFKENEFVSILGASGSGKTTMLNLIGGLDRYTSGDLLIDSKSTKDFKDQDWDAYRNQTIGFVFQSYNLISHLSVLDNVEMALRLSGVSLKERREKAKKVLIEVGLKDHLTKRPNQLSGGQMQRVAIARALVNDPKILLADEPTGALDSKTSHQIMELIKEISKDRLVIMVTHNAEIANEYSDRIVKLVDGKVVEDTNPVTLSQKSSGKLATKKTSMSYLTALKTSFKNLLTKKGRTLMTIFAGSIGIIGIALVLSISTGMTNYTNTLQTDALAGYPITINSIVATDTFGPGGGGGPFGDQVDEIEFIDDPIVYAYDEEASTELHINTIDQSYIDYLNQMDDDYYHSISYTHGIEMTIISKSDAGNYQIVPSSGTGMAFFGTPDYFFELPNNDDFILSQYTLLDGTYPESFDELVLVVDESNRLDVELLEKIGLNLDESYSFDELIGLTFKIIPNDLYYQSFGNTYLPRTDYQNLYESNESIEVSITGIIRIKEDATSEVLSSGIGYTTLLTDYMLTDASTSNIVLSQIANPTINVLTGLSFTSQLTYDDVMLMIGGDQTPTGVQIYPTSFDAKDAIKDYLDLYNVGKIDEDQIIYTDLAEQISSTISSLINTITIILTAFAAISLVVSSVMIGIITYVSVVERTKEIGIMRSLGARKKDISRIFNAETLLIGFSSGIFGVLVALLLNIPVNAIIKNLIDVEGFSILLLTNAFFLVILSTFLMLIAGLIPSGIAARKDPVIALRTE